MIRLVLSLIMVATVAASPPSTHGTSDEEIRRLDTHFATVLRELREAHVSGLSPAQMTARTTLMARLEHYAANRRFPHNHVVRDAFVPVFRDEHQTLCAMGFLIASTGRDDIVDDVARTANLARIPTLAADGRFRAWLDSVGLSVAEAARIQPEYSSDPPPARSEPRTERRPMTAYYAGSAAVGMLSVSVSALNLFSRGRTPAEARRAVHVGFAAGATQFVVGAFGLDLRAPARTVGVANMLVGVASLGVSEWRAKRLVADPSHAPRTVHVQPLVTGGEVGLKFSSPF